MPFGKVVCISVNDAVLHGLPHDYTLRDGDLVTFDFAVAVDGWVSDSAVSLVVGTPRDEDLRLIDTAKLEEARSLVTRCGGLVAHSGELLKAMGSAIDDQLPLIVPRERVAAMGRELGYINVQVAENALPESMARAVTLALS